MNDQRIFAAAANLDRVGILVVVSAEHHLRNFSALLKAPDGQQHIDGFLIIVLDVGPPHQDNALHLLKHHELVVRLIGQLVVFQLQFFDDYRLFVNSRVQQNYLPLFLSLNEGRKLLILKKDEI